MNWLSRVALVALVFVLPVKIFAAEPGTPTATTALPATTTAPQHRSLVVGIKVAPPFVVKNSDGSYGGISVDIWREIAAANGWKFKFEQADLQALLDGTRTGRFDVGVGAVTVTPERESAFDFSYPFYATGLAIAVPRHHGTGWIAVVKKFFSWQFVSVVLTLGLLLLAFGFVVWLFEQRRNPEMFGGKPHQGIGSSFWWAAVTMTTVGYGDLAPRTLGGRVVGLIWMFVGVIVISSFTASITSSLTVNQLPGGLQGPKDLASQTVAVLPDSTAAEYLSDHHIVAKDYPNIDKALAAVVAKRADAVVYDAPILRYYVHQDFSTEISVLPATFERQDYALILPLDSPLRKPVDLQLIKIIQSPQWKSLLARYLGSQ